MNKQGKGAIVSDVREKILKSKAIFITEYKGLKVGELTNLRRELRAKNGDMKIVKNTLFLRAANGIIPEINEKIFTGPTAVMFSYGDPTLVAKQIVGFSKNNPLLVIKGGILENDFILPERVMLLSTLPEKEVLLSMLLNVLSSPLTRLANAISSPISGLINVLNAIKENKINKN
ncbi:MAG: 50S ribosomal protein L10 [bacterium]